MKISILQQWLSWRPRTQWCPVLYLKVQPQDFRKLFWTDQKVIPSQKTPRKSWNTFNSIWKTIMTIIMVPQAGSSNNQIHVNVGYPLSTVISGSSIAEKNKKNFVSNYYLIYHLKHSHRYNILSLYVWSVRKALLWPLSRYTNNFALIS